MSLKRMTMYTSEVTVAWSSAMSAVRSGKPATTRDETATAEYVLDVLCYGHRQDLGKSSGLLSSLERECLDFPIIQYFYLS